MWSNVGLASLIVAQDATSSVLGKCLVRLPPEERDSKVRREDTAVGVTVNMVKSVPPRRVSFTPEAQVAALLGRILFDDAIAAFRFSWISTGLATPLAASFTRLVTSPEQPGCLPPYRGT